MTFFPDQIMPKQLKRETSKEVANSPFIYNARDHNIHHREIRAMQELLIGAFGTTNGIAPGSGTEPGDEATGGKSDDGGMSINDLVVRFTEIIELMATQGFVGMYSGTVQAGGQVQIPSNIIRTQTVGSVLATDTSIPVASTGSFPESGVITKFNRLDTIELCTDGSPPGAGSRCTVGAKKIIGYENLITSGSHATNQEVINYTSKTATSFEGCTRGVNSSTAQDATESQPALIMNGRAAISLGHNFWGRGTQGAPNQFYLAHDAMLKTSAALQAKGSRTRQGKVLQDIIEISWLLSYVGYFASVDVNQVFTPIG